ncbi:MAG: hypothetical protein JNK72_06620 [Myxococcales bacterium]|nr:hypothetical protein [Myxococcales bacterium]
MSTVEERLANIERKLDMLLAASKTQGGARPGAAASNGGGYGGGDLDADIDGPRGDPEVRFVPKRWQGADFKGQKFSQCDPEFLDMLASSYDWFAQQDDEKGVTDAKGNPKSKWSRLDAARARAWAARLRGDTGGAAAPRRQAAPARSAPVSNGGGSMGRSQSAPMPPTDFDDDIPF